jgi:proteic killer suppression protein
MIKHFKCPETEKIYKMQVSTKLPSTIQSRARRKLLMLDSADTLNDLKIPPSNHLEKLSGNRQGQYSIRVNDQWRLCFTWEGKDAYRVEMVDYH